MGERLARSPRPAETPGRSAGPVVPRASVRSFQHLVASVGNHALQRASRGYAAGAAPGHGGHGLDPATRQALETAYQTDLGAVRLHTDAAAARAAQALGAGAFALGNDIWFGPGRYRPQHPEGRYLLAHEVAHTIQQRGRAAAIQPFLEVGARDDPAETRADRAASAVVRGDRPPSVGASDAVIRRYTITGVDRAVEDGETIVYVNLDTGVRYRVRRLRRVEFIPGRPGRFLPPDVSTGMDARDVWVEISWCTTTRGTVDVGADIPARLQDLINRLITAATSGGDPAATLSATQVQPFVDFIVAASGGATVSGNVHVTVGRSGATGGGGGLSISSGEWSGGVTLETGGGPTTVMFTITFTPGAESPRFACPREGERKGRFVPRTWYECTHTTPTTPTTPEPSPPDERTVSLYYVYAHPTVREDASRGELERLSDLLGRGYRITGIEGFTSPEGPMPPRPSGRFEGNIALAQERADAALARARTECGSAARAEDACFLGGAGAIHPMGRGELHTLTRRVGIRTVEVERGPLATHAVAEFLADPAETARLTDADRRAPDAARTDIDRAAIIYPYLRRAVLTLRHDPPAPAAATGSPLATSLPLDYYYCPPDIIDRARPEFDRPLGPRR